MLLYIKLPLSQCNQGGISPNISPGRVYFSPNLYLYHGGYTILLRNGRFVPVLPTRALCVIVVITDGDGSGVIGAEGLFVDSEGTFEEWFCFCVFLLIIVEHER